MSESPAVSQVAAVCLHFCCVLPFLARYNSRYDTERSLTNAKSIAWIRFASNLVLLRNLQLLCCKLWPSAPRDVCHHMITFFNSWLKPIVHETAWEKKPFRQTSGINSKIKINIFFFTFSVESMSALVTSSYKIPIVYLISKNKNNNCITYNNCDSYILLLHMYWKRLI